nr:hypothetical protein [Frankia sp. Cas4]
MPKRSPGGVLAADGGEATTSAHAALILDLKRTYLEMRPRLRRIYSLAADPAAALSQFAPLGFARLPDGAAEIGGTTYHALYNDFGPSSIDGWLTDLAAREMLIDDALLDPDRRQLILDDTRTRSHQAGIRCPSVPARTRRPDRRPGGTATRRMGLRLERRQQRRRGRDQRPPPQTR